MTKILILICTVAMANGATRDVTYTIRDLCAPNTCFAVALNDKGQVAGSIVNSTFEPFAIFSGNTIVALEVPSSPPGFPPLFSGLIGAMNNAGAVVGTLEFFPSFMGLAVAWKPSLPTPQALVLNSLFGPRFTIGNAVYINNRNNIAGNGLFSPLPPLIPGVSLNQLRAITDNGSVIGNLSDGTVVDFTPGIGTQFFPAGPNSEPGMGQIVFNSRGEIAFPSNPPVLFTPGKGTKPLPSGLEPFALNDSDLIVGRTSKGLSIFDASGTIPNISSQPVPLNSLIPADSGWDLSVNVGIGLVAINNAGQILVSAAQNSSLRRGGSVLLTPSNFPKTQPSTDSTAGNGRSTSEKATSRCFDAALNGVPISPCVAEPGVASPAPNRGRN